MGIGLCEFESHLPHERGKFERTCLFSFIRPPRTYSFYRQHLQDAAADAETKGQQKSRAGPGRAKAVKHNQFIASNLQEIVPVFSPGRFLVMRLISAAYISRD